jgi:peptidoglycan hydrolase CwlO-like protein
VRKYKLKHYYMAIYAAIIAALVIMLAAQPPAYARGEGDSLQAEADRVTYELLELRATRKAAEDNIQSLREELTALDYDIAAASQEIQLLERDLSLCQEAYNQSIRSLYKRGAVTGLEVLLEEEELAILWEDVEYYRRMMESEGEILDDLKSKIDELGLKKRDLNEYRQRRERLSEALDIDLLDTRISELEARLSETNKRMRESRSGAYPQESDADPGGYAIPSPGKLLERVPSMPPLSDFERTGIRYSGYTTSYGAEFHGRPTASGVIFNMNDYTCAHRSLPFATWLLVTFNGSQVIVQVNDRGPFVPGRVLDLSRRAAESIGLDGVQWTDFEILVPRGS